MSEKKEQELVPLDKVAVIRTQSGVARLFARTVTLSVKDKTLVAVPGMKVKVNVEGRDEWRDTYLVSATGFTAMAAEASLFTINSPTVCVDGKEQPNPFVVRDEKQHIRAVYCRSLTFGFTPLGVPTVSDRTAIFDIHQYRLTDLLAKAKSLPNEFKLLPAESAGPQGWVRYPVDEFLNLWANPTAAEFVKWVAQMVNRERKAVEIAQTFAQRNSIKNHPAITVGTSMTNTLPVRLYSWIPTEGMLRWDLSKWEGSIKQIQGMTKGGVDRVQVVSGQDQVHEEPATVAAEVRADLDEAGAPVEVDEDDPRQPATEEAKPKQGTLCDQIKDLYDAIDPKTFNFQDACEKAGIKLSEGEAWELASEAKLVKLLNAMGGAKAKADTATKKKGGGK